MDIGVALIVTHVAGFREWYYYGLNISFIIGIDIIDIVYARYIKKTNPSGHKYYWTHFPLCMIPTGFVIGILLNNFFAFPVYTASLLWLLHFIHDSVEPESAIAWLGPFTKQTYRIGISRQFVFRVYKQDVDITVITERWAYENYLRPILELRPTSETVLSLLIFLTGLSFFIYDVL